MPKGKRKGKFEHRRTEQAYSSDEDAGIDMTIDNCSETSGQSDLKSVHDEADNEMQEKFEEKVMELVDALGARANAARAAAMVSLRAALQRRPVAHLLAAHRATLAEHVSRALRRGRGAERRAAAALAPLLSLQIGEEGTEEFMREVRPALAATAVDKSASIDTRTECCSSLAVLCYLLEEDLTEILEVMRMFETIFSGSYLKGDGSVKVSGAAVEEGALHAAALDGWALLLALLEPRHARALLHARGQPPSWHKLAELLEACSLEVRMAAGGALAIAYERIVGDGEGSGSGSGSEGEGGAAALLPAALLPRLADLARDSHKFRAKRDRKLQRATFRDILKYFEEGCAGAGAGTDGGGGGGAAVCAAVRVTVRVGAECVSCASWGARAAYGALAAALGAGLCALAPHALALRAALGLADQAPGTPPARKLNKLQRHLQNNAACKARTVARNKNRDKRSAALAL